MILRLRQHGAQALRKSLEPRVARLHCTARWWSLWVSILFYILHHVMPLRSAGDLSRCLQHVAHSAERMTHKITRTTHNETVVASTEG